MRLTLQLLHNRRARHSLALILVIGQFIQRIVKRVRTPPLATRNFDLVFISDHP